MQIKEMKVGLYPYAIRYLVRDTIIVWPCIREMLFYSESVRKFTEIEEVLLRAKHTFQDTLRMIIAHHNSTKSTQRTIEG